MDHNSDKLQQNYDSAFLALLMDEYAEKLGEQVLQEYEQAGEAEETDDAIDAACYQILRNSKTARMNGHKYKYVFQKIGIVAAVIVILFALLIGVQAAGMDVFGTMARWTGEVFRFQVEDKSTSGVPQTEQQNEMQRMLAELGMPVELAPTWIPEEYTLCTLERLEIDDSFGIYAVYESGNSYINIEVTEYHAASALNSLELQMDNVVPEEYHSNENVFYLFTNKDKWSGAWSDGGYVISLGSFPSRETIIKVIDSIGEIVYE